MTLLLLIYTLIIVPALLAAETLIGFEEPYPLYIIYVGNVLFSTMALLKGAGAVGVGGTLRSRVVRWTLVYFAYTAVQTWCFQHFTNTETEVRQLKSLFIVFVWIAPALSLSLLIRSERDLWTFRRVLALSLNLVSLTVFAAMLAPFLGFEFGESLSNSAGYTRYFGPFGDQVGFVCLLGFFTALSGRRWLSAGLDLSAAMLTGTRGVMVVLLVGTLWFLRVTVFSRRRMSRGRQLLIATLGVLIVIGVVESPLGDVVLDRILDEDVLAAGVRTRMGSMALGWEVFQDNQAFGVGYNGFTEQAYRIGGQNAFDTFATTFLSNTTNPYLEAAVNGGLIGFVLYVLLIASTLRTAARARHTSRPVPGGTVLEGCAIWLVAIAFGLQAAVFFLPHSLICLFFFTSACAASGWTSGAGAEGSRQGADGARALRGSPRPAPVTLTRVVEHHGGGDDRR